MMKNRTIMNSICTRAFRLVAGAALLLAVTVSTASAETLMMPDRDTRMGTDTVVWGVTTLDNGTAYTLDCGDTAGTQNIAGNVTDRSYITLVCNYPVQGLKTATLTVDAESNTVDIQVFDAAALTAEEDRNLGVNMTIEDGLRFLWTSQVSRAANFPASRTTNWSATFSSSGTSLVTAAFHNQGYRIPSDGSPPTELYEKYIVQRGINYVISSLKTIALGTTPQGDDPCVGTPAGDLCTGLYDGRWDDFHQAYTTGVAIPALATSGALTKVVALADVPGNLSADYIVGKTYGEILQRMANSLSWGQIDDPAGGRGGWFYNFNAGGSTDGSTIGWVLLGLFDAQASGAIVPAWVKTEHAFAVDASVNNDGTLDYQSDSNPASNSGVGPSKNGIGLQALFFSGEIAGARRTAITNVVDSWWTGAGGIGGDGWGCSGASGNKGCGYSMFNNFKGLKLQGIQTLPNVGRAAGPGAIPANDWHEDYKDWLVANQTAPTTVGGGSWNGMRLSSQLAGTDSFTSALAELILSPVALVLPDEDIFSTVGLQPFTQNRAVGQSATVTANAESTGGTPVPGATVNFLVLTGPNAGASGSDVTDANGDATFTYTDTGLVVGSTDTIQATIGVLESNIVEVNWGESDSSLLIPIPATNLWALLLLFAALGLVGVLVLRRD